MRFSKKIFLTFLEGALRLEQTSTIDSVQALDIIYGFASSYPAYLAPHFVFLDFGVEKMIFEIFFINPLESSQMINLAQISKLPQSRRIV